MRWMVFVAYISTIAAANWLTSRYGLVPVGFGMMVTAGTFAAGLSFVARDSLQELAGRRAVFAAIAFGAVLSWWLSSPQLAMASGVTFIISESVDMAVYTPLRVRGRQVSAWLFSNVAGSLVDTAVFLGLAGFPLAGFGAQAAVKIAVGVVTPMAAAGVLRCYISARRLALR